MEKHLYVPLHPYYMSHLPIPSARKSQIRIGQFSSWMQRKEEKIVCSEETPLLKTEAIIILVKSDAVLLYIFAISSRLVAIPRIRYLFCGKRGVVDGMP